MKKKCSHINLVPLEFIFARISYPNGYKNPPHYDYNSNIVGAHIARVKKYFCSDCKKEINAPKQKD